MVPLTNQFHVKSFNGCVLICISAVVSILLLVNHSYTYSSTVSSLSSGSYNQARLLYETLPLERLISLVIPHEVLDRKSSIIDADGHGVQVCIEQRRQFIECYPLSQIAAHLSLYTGPVRSILKVPQNLFVLIKSPSHHRLYGGGSFPLIIHAELIQQISVQDSSSLQSDLQNSSEIQCTRLCSQSHCQCVQSSGWLMNMKLDFIPLLLDDGDMMAIVIGTDGNVHSVLTDGSVDITTHSVQSRQILLLYFDDVLQYLSYSSHDRYSALQQQMIWNLNVHQFLKADYDVQVLGQGYTLLDNVQVTLATQLTVNRLERLVRVIELWGDYPVSAVIFINSKRELFHTMAYLNRKAELFKFSVITIVKCIACMNSYPINLLRNIAISQAQTDYSLTMDVDFMPSTDLSIIANKKILPRMLVSKLSAGQNIAVVLPIVGLSASYDKSNTLPLSMKSIQYLRSRHKCVIQEFEHSGHSNSRLSEIVGPLWTIFSNPWQSYRCQQLQMDNTVRLSDRDNVIIESLNQPECHDCYEEGYNQLDSRGFVWIVVPFVGEDSQLFTPTCFENQWEPYMIIPKYVDLSFDDDQADTMMNKVTLYWQGMVDQLDEHCRRLIHLPALHKSLLQDIDPYNIQKSRRIPLLYDMRITNQGGDKQLFTLYLNALQFHFYVAKSVVMVHLDHSNINNGTSSWWSRSDTAYQKETIPASSRKLSYFDDLLPEMLNIFGYQVRMPVKCSNLNQASSRMVVQGDAI
ncbi:hypothetical protein MIR68_011142 [Amoeboaphelidium protococcarum]|nr:hypothetical protein MIR68_011142 [Amoeboaphelidium protococcarum]